MSTAEEPNKGRENQCQAKNEGNSLRCLKKAFGPFEGKVYCKPHLRQQEQRHRKQHILTLTFPTDRSEDQISGSRLWVATVSEADFISALGMYKIHLVIEGEAGRRLTGVWPPQPGAPIPWLCGPTLEAAQHTVTRFNEERGYSADVTRRLIDSASVALALDASSRPRTFNETKSDLQPLELVSDLIGIYGNNDRYFWANKSLRELTGARAPSITVQTWMPSIYLDDRAAVYACMGIIMQNPMVSSAIDFRMRRLSDASYFWVRLTGQPICDPDTGIFLMRSSVGQIINVDQVAFRSCIQDSQIVKASQTQRLIKQLIEERTRRHEQEHLRFDRMVAFVPRPEKLHGFGYRLALAMPGQLNYKLIGHYPYLPTLDYYPPIFLGADINAANRAAETFNTVRGIDREHAMRVLQLTKCIQYT